MRVDERDWPVRSGVHGSRLSAALRPGWQL